MPPLLSEILADTLNVSAVVDGLPIAISELKYSAKVNSARIVTFTVTTKEYAQICRLGGKVVIKSGRERSISNLSFSGIIKQVVPNEIGATLTAMDYITLLATSAYVNYEVGDILGRDLYFLAASAMNIDEIDTTYLTQGSGIRATAAMKLEGLQTRKEFIDKCFSNMYAFVEDTTAYHNKLNVIYYQYNITMSNRMEILKIDNSNIHNGVSLSLSDRSNQVESISAILDTTSMVNSITVTSSKIPEMFFNYADESSIAKYGVMSELISLSTEDYTKLVDEAVKYVNRFKNESYNFTIVLRNVDSLILGDTIEVTISSLERAIRLPIVSYDVDTSSGLRTTIVLGREPLSLAQLISKSL